MLLPVHRRGLSFNLLEGAPDCQNTRFPGLPRLFHQPRSAGIVPRAECVNVRQVVHPALRLAFLRGGCSPRASCRLYGALGGQCRHDRHRRHGRYNRRRGCGIVSRLRRDDPPTALAVCHDYAAFCQQQRRLQRHFLRGRHGCLLFLCILLVPLQKSHAAPPAPLFGHHRVYAASAAVSAGLALRGLIRLPRLVGRQSVRHRAGLRPPRTVRIYVVEALHLRHLLR